MFTNAFSPIFSVSVEVEVWTDGWFMYEGRRCMFRQCLCVSVSSWRLTAVETWDT